MVAKLPHPPKIVYKCTFFFLSASYSRATIHVFPELRVNKSVSSTTLEQLADMFHKLRVQQIIRNIFKTEYKVFYGGNVYHYQWEKPPKGWVKLNTDGSISLPEDVVNKEDEKEEKRTAENETTKNKKARATGAGLFRDSEGDPLLGFQIPLKVPYLPVKGAPRRKKKPATDSYRVEAITAKRGLLMFQFEDILVTPTLRDGNSPANILATWEDFPKRDCSFETMPPSNELEEALQADKDGVWHTKKDKEKKSADKDKEKKCADNKSEA